MANQVEDYVLDLALAAFDIEATDLVICSAEPTTYAEANATYALGRKIWGAGAVFGAPAAGSPNGRTVSAAPITDGTVDASGTATHWAIIDTVNTRLLARGSLASSVAVTISNTFSLSAFDINMPNQA